jgi:hypothetical protein
MMNKLNTKEMQAFFDSQTTDDGRLAPDYAESFMCRKLINDLLETSFRMEGLEK